MINVPKELSCQDFFLGLRSEHYKSEGWVVWLRLRRKHIWIESTWMVQMAIT